MTREGYALDLLRKARRALLGDIVDAVIDSDHLTDHGEMPPYSDSITEAGDRLYELNRTIAAIEEAIEKPAAAPKPPVNEWVHSETT